MSEPEKEEGGDEVTQGVSPYADAWRRLKKNKFAMIGLWVVIVMGLLSALAPVIAPFDATYQFAWIGAQPMGYEHVNVLQKNELRVGYPAEIREDYRDAKQVEFEVQTIDKAAEYAIFASKKTRKIRKIRNLRNTSQKIKNIEVPADSYLVLEVKGSNKPSAPLPPEVVLEVGAELPKEFGEIGKDGKIVYLMKPVGGLRHYVAELEDGEVASLTLNGESAKRAEFDGRDVRWAKADGEEQTVSHLLGTDEQGRDLFSRVLYGGRISLLVGILATIVSLVIGVVYGAASGYFGGKLDAIMMGIVDILYGIPYMFLVILLLVNFGQDIKILFIALGAVQWLTMARIVRGQVLSLREKEFVEAARMSGTGHWGILFGHLIPNTLGVVVVYTTLTVPAVILQESFLAFIGLTVEYEGQSLDSWGALVNTGMQALGSEGERSWLLIWPSLAMAVTLFSLNFLGDGLRDALDPQQRGRT